MIRYARKKDREALLDVCLTSMAMKEKTYLEYYFHHVFQDGSALISELDNKLISQIHMHTHVLKLKEKRWMYNSKLLKDWQILCMASMVFLGLDGTLLNVQKLLHHGEDNILNHQLKKQRNMVFIQYMLILMVFMQSIKSNKKRV